MILDDKIEIKVNHIKVKYYKSLGYDCKGGDIIVIDVNHLSNGSNYKINVKCDICGFEKKLTYHKYLKNIKSHNIYSCSNKCSIKKYKITCNQKYGVDNLYQSEYHKEKIKETNILKYGVDNPSKSIEIQNKIKETCLERYGVDNYFKSDDLKLKRGIILDTELDDWSLYKRISKRLYKISRCVIMESWDGYDYYDGEYIKDNLNLEHYHTNYPTIDHKISVYWGFKNNILPSIINDVNNLVVTKRYINSTKGCDVWE